MDDINIVGQKLHALTNLNLCESEANKMITDTMDIYGDYIADESEELQKEAKQLKYKLLALMIYYPVYFGYDDDLMGQIRCAVYSTEESG